MSTRAYPMRIEAHSMLIEAYSMLIDKQNTRNTKPSVIAPLISRPVENQPPEHLLQWNNHRPSGEMNGHKDLQAADAVVQQQEPAVLQQMRWHAQSHRDSCPMQEEANHKLPECNCMD